MLEDSTGEYKQSSTSTFLGYEYFYNQSKSGCMNNRGKQIKDSLLYNQDNKKATANVSETSRCYLYFDKYKSTSFSDELIASNTLWQSGLEGDGYRFTGSGTATDSTSPKNFICFGTTDKDRCTSNPDLYMYRIIGVFADENGDNHVKLIKYTQLSTVYRWHSNVYSDTDWADSDLYKGLNGSYFLTNTTYSYMQDNTWLSKITDWKWIAVNTKTYDGSSGPNYYNSLSSSNICLHEMNRSTKTSTIGEWTTPTAKIGLMYVSDYALSLGATALSMTTSTKDNASTLITGWMHQSNNDTSASIYEWTISRVGAIGSSFRAWGVNSAGYIGDGGVTDTVGASPVLYLESNVTAVGAGTLESPYMITDDSGTATPLKVSLSNSDSTLNAVITKGTGNLNKYCINTSASITNCIWNNITSTSITYIMPDYGTYYVHVIDDAGYIAHSSFIYRQHAWGLAKDLIDSGDLWDSKLKGDGLRYAGTGTVCSYNNGEYFASAENLDTTPTCPTYYNYTRINTKDWTGDNFTFQKSCPSSTSIYKYSCRKLSVVTPIINYICFGTTNKDTCTSNPGTYMYRIIGTFIDENGDYHLKLIKYTQLSAAYAWNSSNTNVDWANSTLHSGLNGSYFLTNTTYSYMQDSTWLNKIANWEWTTVNTLTSSSSGLNYNDIRADYVCLHEMNRSTKTSTIGEWTTTNSKIGLIYVSDYALSFGESSYTGSSNASTLKKGWMHQSNNDISASEYEWTVGRYGIYNASTYYNWYLDSTGSLAFTNSTQKYGIRPVFYLTSDVTSSSGTGTLSDPYILDVS